MYLFEKLVLFSFCIISLHLQGNVVFSSHSTFSWRSQSSNMHSNRNQQQASPDILISIWSTPNANKEALELFQVCLRQHLLYKCLILWGTLFRGWNEFENSALNLEKAPRYTIPINRICNGGETILTPHVIDQMQHWTSPWYCFHGS